MFLNPLYRKHAYFCVLNSLIDVPASNCFMVWIMNSLGYFIGIIRRSGCSRKPELFLCRKSAFLRQTIYIISISAESERNTEKEADGSLNTMVDRWIGKHAEVTRFASFWKLRQSSIAALRCWTDTKRPVSRFRFTGRFLLFYRKSTGNADKCVRPLAECERKRICKARPVYLPFLQWCANI